jgi:broad specificity phosphatase PhoE
MLNTLSPRLHGIGLPMYVHTLAFSSPHVTIVNINPSRPIFLISTFLIFFFFYASMDSSSNPPIPASPPRDFHFKYTILPGYFQQSESSTDDTQFDFKKSNFGLINRSYSSDETNDEQQWPRFTQHIRHLASASNVKVLWLGRHGQGFHNVAETKYGTKAWDCYWSALDGADGIEWLDAHLTDVGVQQALDVNALWKQQLPHGIPMPQRFYVSPLTRTIQTADATFSSIEAMQYKPYIKELVREALGIHTCDKRSTKSHIETTFPHVAFEPNFSDADVLWEKDYREPVSARNYRLATFLDDVFAHDDGLFLSMTSHSGAIASMLEVLGHRKFALETGGVIPVVVRAERVEGSREVPEKEPSDAPPMCKEPPEL